MTTFVDILRHSFFAEFPGFLRLAPNLASSIASSRRGPGAELTPSRGLDIEAKAEQPAGPRNKVSPSTRKGPARANRIEILSG
jgi:hypothetical protein